MKMKLILALTLSALSLNASALQTAYHSAYITAIINDTKNYSGCMLRLEPNFSSPTNCGRKDFVSLDCEAVAGVNSKSSAQLLMNAAQLAFVANYKVRLRITDNTVDGFCVADYIRMDQEAPAN